MISMTDFESAMSKAGDAYINYRSQNSNKIKYVVGTLDFSCDYIQEKLTRLNMKRQTPSDSVLLFCWDIDGFKAVKLASIVSILPLNKVLKNLPA